MIPENFNGGISVGELNRLIDQGLERDAEIARLRADVERKDEALRAADGYYHAMYPVICKGADCTTCQVRKQITAALADTADKQGEQ